MGRPSRNGYILFLAGLWVLIGISGCGPSKTEVSGTIKIKGKAPDIKGLEISFLVSGGKLISAPINPDGSYSAKDIPVGEVKIAFIYMPPDLAPKSKDKHLVRPGKGEMPKVGRNPIPEHLREANTSKLSIQVVAGEPNVFNHDIQP